MGVLFRHASSMLARPRKSTPKKRSNHTALFQDVLRQHLPDAACALRRFRTASVGGPRQSGDPRTRADDEASTTQRCSPSPISCTSTGPPRSRTSTHGVSSQCHSNLPILHALKQLAPGSVRPAERQLQYQIRRALYVAGGRRAKGPAAIAFSGTAGVRRALSSKAQRTGRVRPRPPRRGARSPLRSSGRGRRAGRRT